MADPGRNQPFFIVYNPASGLRDEDRTRAKIASVLRAAGRAHYFARVAADSVARARAADGVVVAAGGDGTLNAVAHAALGSGCAFGVIPLGTFNYFSRAHGIPAAPEAAARLLLQGRVRPVRVGRVNDRIFLVNASLGMYPALLEDREAAKRLFGRRRAVVFGSALATLLREHRRLGLRMEHDGQLERLGTSTLFVGNNRLQLEQFGLPAAEVIDDARLAAIALRPVRPLAMLWLALKGTLGRLGDADNLISFGFREMTLGLSGQPARKSGRRRIKVATDGEVSRMWLPLRFAVAAEALPLIVPDGAVDRGSGD